MGCSPGIESAYPANLLLQRPTSAYYRIETALHWPKKNPQLAKKVPAATVAVPNTGIGGGGGDGGTPCDGPGSTAGLIARELNTGAGVAIGLVCNSTTGTATSTLFVVLTQMWFSPPCHPTRAV